MNRRVQRRWLVLLILLMSGLAVAGLPAAPAAEEQVETVRDEWQTLYLQDQKVGYMHVKIVRRSTAEGPRYVTTRKEQVSLSRGAITMTITQESRVTEDEAGRLISFESERQQGPLTQTTRGEVKGNRLVITTGKGSTQQRKTVPVPDGLCPAALDRYTQEKGYEPGTTYSVKVFEPTMADAAEGPKIDIRVGEVEPREIFEVTKWLHRVEMESDLLAGITGTEWVDDAGRVWASRVPIGPGLTFKTRRVSREVALQPSDAPELMFSTAVEPDKPIENGRRLRRAVLLLKPAGRGAKIPALPRGEWQSVEEVEGGTRVTIRRAAPSPEGCYSLPYSGEEHAKLLEPTPWLEVNHPTIKEMAREAVGGEKNALRAARRIEGYVSEEITEKNLSMGFATALETARQKTGDCSEHALLAAALARAAGMPSRVVLGMAYLRHPTGDYRNGAFFYHMWAEVFVGRWVPIDGALRGHTATHLALARSDLNRSADLVTISAPILQVLGSIEVHVVSTRE